MNNELFRRLQKAESASTRLDQVVSKDTTNIKRLDEVETKRNAFDAAAMLHLFLPGLTMIEREDG